MATKVWGPPIWTLFHAMAEKIHENRFAALKTMLFHHFKNVCFNLPCPTCANHARSFLSKINFAKINDKTTFQNFLHMFHDTVNARKKTPAFDKSKLSEYRNINLASAFNNFLLVYNTKGNMLLLADSFHRSMIMKRFKEWFANNASSFDA
jgi:hypothetical protein